jgi:plasmid replication initiation protein
VYAELNFFDGNVSAAIEECYSSVIANSATIEDIPDEGLREEIRAKILEVTIAHIESDPEAAAILASRLEYLPLYDIVRFIQLGNTPEFMAKYNQTLYSSQLVIAMDLDILAFGRPGGGLEYVSF